MRDVEKTFSSMGGIVYDLGTQKMNFVAPMPEQIGTSAMHFPEVLGGTY